MKKGIIMEIHDGFLTLLTPDGEFLRARKLHNHYQIGQEIDFFPVAAIDRKKPHWMNLFAFIKGKAIAAASIAILLSVILFLAFNQNDKVYAYMSIDINPSLELGVNENLKVVELTPYNKEGRAIIEEIHGWKKKDFSVVTEKILAKIKEKGYINEKKDLVISTVYTGKREKSSDKEILKELNKIESDFKKQDLKVTIVEGTAEEREKAIKQGITTGTYKKQQEIIFEASSIKKKENANDSKKQLVGKHNNSVNVKKTSPQDSLNKEVKQERNMKEKNQVLQHEEKLHPKQHKIQENKHEEQPEKRDKNNKKRNPGIRLNENTEKQSLCEKNKKKNNYIGHEKHYFGKEKQNSLKVKIKTDEKKNKTNDEKHKDRHVKRNGEKKNNIDEKNQRKKGDYHKEKSGDM
ncbi:SigI regulator RsgI [Bacillus methanolicus]|nr:SigI regulator RsgI [Bacillus methanolicus]